MKKLLCVLTLFAGMAGLATTLPLAPAQEKKDTKKDTKAGVIEVNEGKDGKFRFTVRDGEGKFLAQSGAYEDRADAIKGIETLKAVLPKATIAPPKK